MVPWLVFLIIVISAPSSAFAQRLNACLRCHDPCHRPQISATEQQDCTFCHRGNDQTTRKDLAHHFLIGRRYAWYRLPQSAVVVEGEKRMDQLACRRCHVQQKKGNQLAVDLDRLLASSSVEELESALQDPAFYMPDFNLSQLDLNLLITQIFAGGVNADTFAIAPPVVVHFEDDADQEHLFEKHCGSCHRVLTGHLGGLGKGTVAPNLSGLLTPYYPKNYKEHQPWDVDGLTKWIRNPRSIRRLSWMPPLRLDEKQIKQLIDSTWPEEFRKEHQ